MFESASQTQVDTSPGSFCKAPVQRAAAPPSPPDAADEGGGRAGDPGADGAGVQLKPVAASVAPLVSHWTEATGQSAAPQLDQKAGPRVTAEPGCLQLRASSGVAQDSWDFDSAWAGMEQQGGAAAPSQREPQLRAATGGGERVRDAADLGTSGTGGQLPHLEAIRQSFGHHDVSQVKAHTGTAAQAGAQAMGAEAFATGNQIAFAGTPSLHTAAHEAAHVVQQRGGVQLKGGVGEVGDAYEQHADEVADRVVQGKSAESLLDRFAGTTPSAGPDEPVQRKVVQMAPMVPRADGVRKPDGTAEEEDVALWGPTEAKAWRETLKKVGRGEPGYEAGLTGYKHKEWQAAFKDPQVKQALSNLLTAEGRLNHADSQIDKRDPARLVQAKTAIQAFRAESANAPNNKYQFKTADGKQDELADRLTAIVDNPLALNQVDYAICGANTFLHSVCVYYPDTFVQYILGMIKNGNATLADPVSLGGMNVKASKQVRQKDQKTSWDDQDHDDEKGPKNRSIHLADWIAMASLRSHSNSFHKNITRTSFVAGSTLPPQMKKWYRDFGWKITQEHLTYIKGLSAPQLLQIKDAYDDDHEVALFVSGGHIADGKMPSQGDNRIGSADHWVRLASKIDDHDTDKKGTKLLHFRVWSWGTNYFMRVEEPKVKDVVFGYIVAQRPAAGGGGGGGGAAAAAAAAAAPSPLDDGSGSDS